MQTKEEFSLMSSSNIIAALSRVSENSFENEKLSAPLTY